MGLFFKRTKKDSVDTLIESIYAKMNPELRDNVFYGGLESAKQILKGICVAVFSSVNENNISLCYDIYVQVWIRSRGGFQPKFMTPTYIREALIKKYSFISENTVTKCVNASLNIIYNQEPALKEKAMQIESLTEYLAITVRQNAEKNFRIEDKHLGEYDYGLCANKPVFVNGFVGATVYLSMLKTVTGCPIKYKRLGSINIESIAGPVDMYEVVSPQEKLTYTIFICNYGSKNSNSAPRGLMLTSNNF